MDDNARETSRAGPALKATETLAETESSATAFPPIASSASSFDDDVKPVRLAIDDRGNTTLSAQYVRTRHNNLRCFPRCSDPHSPTSFCGQSITGTVWLDRRTYPDTSNKIEVMGGFRNIQAALSLEKSDTLGKPNLGGDALMPGSCVEINPGEWRFTFTPIRKWQYSTEDRVVANDRHVFTVYVLLEATCIAHIDSNAFHVMPIWTAERDKESQRRTKARLKKKERSHGDSGSASPESSRPSHMASLFQAGMPSISMNMFSPASTTSPGSVPVPSFYQGGQQPPAYYFPQAAMMGASPQLPLAMEPGGHMPQQLYYHGLLMGSHLPTAQFAPGQQQQHTMLANVTPPHFMPQQYMQHIFSPPVIHHGAESLLPSGVGNFAVQSMESTVNPYSQGLQRMASLPMNHPGSSNQGMFEVRSKGSYTKMKPTSKTDEDE